MPCRSYWSRWLYGKRSWNGSRLSHTSAALNQSTPAGRSADPGVEHHCWSTKRLEIKLFTTHRMLWSRLFGLVVFAYVLLAAPPTFFAAWIVELGELAGFVLLSAAAFGRLWCLVYIAGKKNKTLLTEGPYSITRNPLYVFSFLGAVGFGLAVENPWLAATIGVCFAVCYSTTVAYEEKRLLSIFGAAYAAYSARTPRWIPNFRLYHEPQTLIVCPAKIQRGILDAMWFLWAFWLWEVLEVLRKKGVLRTWI